MLLLKIISFIFVYLLKNNNNATNSIKPNENTDLQAELLEPVVQKQEISSTINKTNDNSSHTKISNKKQKQQTTKASEKKVENSLNETKTAENHETKSNNIGNLNLINLIISLYS